jgi:hypothetical protein
MSRFTTRWWMCYLEYNNESQFNLTLQGRQNYV